LFLLKPEWLVHPQIAWAKLRAFQPLVIESHLVADCQDEPKGTVRASPMPVLGSRKPQRYYIV
jgi:hypothetical protein